MSSYKKNKPVSDTPERSILVTDIGATNSRFALMRGTPLRLHTVCSVSSDLPSFDATLMQVRRECPGLFATRADCLVLAAAGPVHNADEVRMTNRTYSISRNQLKPLAEHVLFINDFESQARACATHVIDTAQRILPGCLTQEISPRQRLELGIGIIGAGTGLGAAFCRESNSKMLFLPSEGGHISASFLGGEESAFAQYLQNSLGRDGVEYEDILSGKGLQRLHGFLTGQSLPAPQITASPGFADSRTCAWFARFYGRACRNLALAMLPRGGLVISGGMAGRIPALVTHQAFRNEFLDMREPLRHLLSSIPVWLNHDETAGLWGAAHAALEHLNNQQSPEENLPAIHI